MRKLKVAILVFLVFAFSFAFVFTATPAKPSDKGLPIIYLSGTPREMGLRQGLLLKESIKENLNLFWEAVVSQGQSKRGLLAQAISWERFLPPNIAQELRAMAEGARVNYYELVAFNLFEENFMDGGCTMGVAEGTGTLTGQVLGWKNRDSGGNEVIVIRDPPTGSRFKLLAITSSGGEGISQGVNAAGVHVGNTVLYGPSEYPAGLDNLIVNRIILENASSVEEAINIVNATSRQDPSCFMAIDANKAAFIEAVPSNQPPPGIVVNITENGVAGHANHYVYEPFYTLWKAYATASSLQRQARIEALLTRDEGEITVKLMMQYSRDFVKIYTIDNSGTKSAGVHVPSGTYPTWLSTMWASMFRPGYCIYTPLHNAILHHPSLASTELAEYFDTTAYNTAKALTKYKKSPGNWNTTRERFVLIEDDIRNNNAFNENLVINCYQKGASLEDCTKHLVIQDSWCARRVLDIERFMTASLTPPVTSLYIPPNGPARARLTTQTSPPGVGAPILGEGWYDLGYDISVKAPATYGQYTFDHWTVDGNTVPGNPITVTMNTNCTATAYYN